MSKKIISTLAGLGLAFTASANIITYKSNAEISEQAKSYAVESSILANAQTKPKCYNNFKSASFMLNEIPISIEKYGRDHARNEVAAASMYVHSAALAKCGPRTDVEVFDHLLKIFHSSF